jgi:hypothetical protein
MIEINLNKDELEIYEKHSSLKLNELSTPNNDQIINYNYNDLNYNNNIQNKNDQKQTNTNKDNVNIRNTKSLKILDTIKDKNLQINSKINKVKTFDKDKRIDRYGNTIIHGGKQKVSFIDKISKNNLFEVVKVENFKQFNKMEETSKNIGNGCCLLF